MTDRRRTLIVVLDQDVRDDDIEEWRKVLLAIRGVDRVELGGVVGGDVHFARTTLAWKFGQDLRDFVYKWLKDNA